MHAGYLSAYGVSSKTFGIKYRVWAPNQVHFVVQSSCFGLFTFHGLCMKPFPWFRITVIMWMLVDGLMLISVPMYAASLHWSGQM